MKGFHFEGRGFPRPTVAYHFGSQRVMIRIDDESNPEAWAQIDITAESLLLMLRELLPNTPENQHAAAELADAWELAVPCENGVVDVSSLFRMPDYVVPPEDMPPSLGGMYPGREPEVKRPS